VKRFRAARLAAPAIPNTATAPASRRPPARSARASPPPSAWRSRSASLNARFGDDLIDHRTYVLASDGDLHGGHQPGGDLARRPPEALQTDRPSGTTTASPIDGPTELTRPEDAARFRAAGWPSTRVDGHDHRLRSMRAIDCGQKSDRPTMIACKTVIGFGAPKKAGTASAHGSPLGPAEAAAARAAYGWTDAPFELPADVRDGWRICALRAGQGRKEWEKRYRALPPEERAEFDRRVRGDLPSGFDEAIRAHKHRLVSERPTVATRKASEMALDVINAVVPETIGGSADLTGSVNTRSAGMTAVTPEDFSGRFVHWGIREHGMAAAMNGMALHGGVIPYAGTFLVFSDYCRPAIRLSALMGLRVVYVMTHDSIGLGEDGPTHQPVEHLAALRAIPNLVVMRPADVVETAECWQIALESRTTPSVLVLTRQNLPTVRTHQEDANLCARGAYELAEADGEADVSLFASGSEVEIALAARRLLSAEGIAARVVSVPSFELFAQQSAHYRAEVIGTAPVRVGIEAAVRMGWDAIIGTDGIFVGMSGFGASGRIEDLYPHFGITAERAATLAREALAAKQG
jgi:transketolase